jgi:hypothetical protein
MHGPINVKSPNNISKWHMGFNSAFKGLKTINYTDFLIHIMAFHSLGCKAEVVFHIVLFFSFYFISLYIWLYVWYASVTFFKLRVLIVMSVPFWILIFIVLFRVLFVCKCVLYYCHRAST